MDKPLTDLEYSLIPGFPHRPVNVSGGPIALAPAGERCGLWIFICGISSVARNSIDLRSSPARSFEFFSVAHVYGGGGVHWTAAGGLQRVEAGDVVVSLPGNVHIYGPRAGEEWREDWLAFVGPRAQMLRESGMLQDGVLKNILTARRVREVARLAQLQSYEGILRAGAMLELLLTDLHLACRARQTAGVLSGVQTLAGEIDAFPEEGWTLPEMARRAGMSQSHLRRLFVQAFGVPPHEYLEQARLRKGAELLRDTGRPVGEIAQAAGYADPFHFSARFRKHFGVSPRAYRDLIQKRV